MKRTQIARLVFSMLFALGLSLAPFTAHAADDSWTPGRYMRQAMDNMMTGVRAINDMYGIGYDGSAPCLVATYLTPGSSHSFERHFDAGETYYIVACGDEDARDIDVELLSRDGSAVASDTRSDSTAVVEFTPWKSGMLTVRLKLYAAETPSFCSFAVLRKNNGWDIPAVNVYSMLDTFFSRCRDVADKWSGDGYKSGFLTEAGQATIWASVLQPGQSTTIENIRLGSKLTVLRASGDTQSQDIDMWLRTSGGTQIASDTEADSNPVCTAETGSFETYSVELKNVTSSGASMVMFGVVQRGERIDN